MNCHRLARLSTSFLVLASIAGCSSSPWRQSVIKGNDRVFLYKEHKEAEGKRVGLGLAHPVNVSERDVGALLSNLIYVKKTLFADPQKIPIFTESEARRLALPVAKALSTLTPDERLRFLVPSQNFTNLFHSATGTSGVIFARNADTLDLAFDRVHEGINDGDGGRPEEVDFADDPTSLTKTTAVVPVTGSRRRVDTTSRQDYPGWIVVDRTKLATLEHPSPLATKPTRQDPEPTAAVDSSPPAKTSTVDAAAAGEAEAAGADAKYQDVRRKIENLKRLHKDGVITDEEYKSQFDGLMRDL